MDPDAILAALRELIGLYNSGQATGADTDRIVDLSQALDEWFTRGGFLPAAWQFWRADFHRPPFLNLHPSPGPVDSAALPADELPS